MDIAILDWKAEVIVERRFDCAPVHIWMSSRMATCLPSREPPYLPAFLCPSLPLYLPPCIPAVLMIPSSQLVVQLRELCAAAEDLQSELETGRRVRREGAVAVEQVTLVAYSSEDVAVANQWAAAAAAALLD